MCPLVYGTAARDGECLVETEYPSATVRYVSYVAMILNFYIIPFCVMLAVYVHMGVILYRSASSFNGMYIILLLHHCNYLCVEPTVIHLDFAQF